MPLSSIVNVQISRQTQSIPIANFGFPMVLGTFKNWNDLIRVYSSLDGVADDFTSNQPEYIAAQAIFSQNPSPTTVYIGRRNADVTNLNVITGQLGQIYTTTINNVDSNVTSSAIQQQSTIVWNDDFVTDNLINVEVNGTVLGTINSVIDFDTPFVWNNSVVSTVNGIALTAVPYDNVTTVVDFDIDFISTSSILSTINGIALTPVLWNVNQAGTIADVATEMATAANVTSATVTGPRQITVVFTVAGSNTVNSVVTSGAGTQPVSTITDSDTTIDDVATVLAGATGVASATVTDTLQITVIFTSPGANTVNSIITTLGASQPVATISEGGFVFTVDQATTIAAIALAIEGVSTVFSATVGTDSITILSNAAQTTIVNDASVFLGATQAIATITNDSLRTTIAKEMVAKINAQIALGVTASFTSSPEGNYTLTADVSGTPYTVSVSTDITTPNSAYVEITNVVVNQNYVITLNGVNYEFLADASIQTNDQISLELVALINANTGNSGISAVDNGDGSFIVSAATAFSIFITAEVMSKVVGIRILPLTATDTVATTLTNIANVNNDWYALVCTDRTVAVVQAVATWAEARIKIFGTASSDLNIINQSVSVDTTSIAAWLQNQGYIRTFCMYHQDANSDYPEAAWMGVVLPETPGSETWKFKRLAGVAYSNLTTTQDNNALSKNCNTYEFIGGVGITQNGTMAQGEFIDIIRGVDWLQSTIQNLVYSKLVNLPKVPYTDAGITVIQGQVKQAIQLGIDNNFISNDPAPTITVPLAANVPAIDKANRVLNNVKFQCTLAGAIHAVNINGVVTV